MKSKTDRKEDPGSASALQLPLEDVPEYLARCLETYKIHRETIELTLKLDSDMDFSFGEVWVLVTHEEFCILSGEYVKEKGWIPGEYHIYSREEYEQLACDNLPTSGILTAVRENVYFWPDIPMQKPGRPLFS